MKTTIKAHSLFIKAILPSLSCLVYQFLRLQGLRLEKPNHRIFKEIRVASHVEPQIQLKEVSVYMLLAHVIERADNRAVIDALG